jgi:hypothetical protein
LTHPSGKTLVSWLDEIGFTRVEPTHSGAWFAGRLFEEIAQSERPNTIEAIDALLEPVIRTVVQMAAPLAANPPLTAIK